MPIRESTYLKEVFCLNHEQHIKFEGIHDHQTTMAQVGGTDHEKWYALTEVIPRGKTDENKTRFLNTTGIPVRVYTCKFCGYCEFYHGKIVEPDSWKK
jgi:predicted nucleic-acid-binding Zn-ribbon protein